MYNINDETKKMIPIDDIIIGERYRKDFGDIDVLAESMQELGLLQPIGLTLQKMLVWGERRIRAAKKLGWDEIEYKIVNIDSILEGEYAENEMRKGFTVSERVAIAAALEEEMGERRGNPNLKKGNDLSIVKPVTQLGEGPKTRDVAAKKSGLGSGVTYQAAKKVVTKGTDELKTAMDKSIISIKDAAVLVEQSPEDQARILILPKKERRVAIDDLRGLKRGSVTLNGNVTTQQSPPTLFSRAEQTATLVITKLEGIQTDDPKLLSVLIEIRDWCDAYIKKIEEKNNGKQNL